MQCVVARHLLNLCPVSPTALQGNSRSLPLASMQAAEGAGSVAPDVPPQPAVYVESRRQLARWTPGEVAALIAGVQMHGTHWSAIHEVYTPTGCINPARTQVGGRQYGPGMLRAC